MIYIIMKLKIMIVIKPLTIIIIIHLGFIEKVVKDIIIIIITMIVIIIKDIIIIIVIINNLLITI